MKYTSVLLLSVLIFWGCSEDETLTQAELNELIPVKLHAQAEEHTYLHYPETVAVPIQIRNISEKATELKFANGHIPFTIQKKENGKWLSMNENSLASPHKLVLEPNQMYVDSVYINEIGDYRVLIPYSDKDTLTSDPFYVKDVYEELEIKKSWIITGFFTQVWPDSLEPPSFVIIDNRADEEKIMKANFGHYYQPLDIDYETEVFAYAYMYYIGMGIGYYVTPKLYNKHWLKIEYELYAYDYRYSDVIPSAWAIIIKKGNKDIRKIDFVEVN